AEFKEWLAGYQIVEVADEARAVEIAARVSAGPGRHGGPTQQPGPLRQGMEDGPPDAAALDDYLRGAPRARPRTPPRTSCPARAARPPPCAGPGTPPRRPWGRPTSTGPPTASRISRGPGCCRPPPGGCSMPIAVPPRAVPARSGCSPARCPRPTYPPTTTAWP